MVKGRLGFKRFFILLIVLSMILPSLTFAVSEEDILFDGEINQETMEQMKEIADRYKDKSLKPFLYPSLKELKGEEEVVVIVELIEKPVTVEKGLHKLQGKTFTTRAETNAMNILAKEQKTFINNVKKEGLSVNIRHRYSNTVNAISMKIKASEIDKLLEVEGVRAVYPNIEYQLDPQIKDEEIVPAMVDSAPHIGAPQIWELGYEGEGIKVGVIDTGIDYLHPDLADAYKGGYDFVNEDDDPYETTPSERPEDSPEIDPNGRTFYTDHGTHVAGTIAARGVNDLGVKGIAPKADIYAYKVLGPYGSGDSEDTLRGIEKAVGDGMDVINLSLGNALNDPNYITCVAVNNAMLAGVVSVVAAGNSGPEKGSTGSPGVGAFAITVGATTVPINKVTASGNFTVSGKVETILNGIVVEPSEVDIEEGKTQQLAVIAKYSDGTKKDITSEANYESKDNTIVEVSNTGLVTGSSVGTGTITVRYEDKETSVRVNVKEKVKLNPPTLVSDTTDNIIGQDITITFDDNEAWRSAITDILVNNESISGKYTVNEGKIVLAAEVFSNPGAYEIVVKAVDYLDANVSQVITNESGEKVLTELTVSPGRWNAGKGSYSLDLESADTVQLTVMAKYSDGSDENVTAKAIYTSDNEEAVIIDPDGKLQAGWYDDYANVTISYGGQSVSLYVTVSSGSGEWGNISNHNMHSI